MHLALLERDLRVRVRDGTPLATDVYRPRWAARVPALLLRTPYDRKTLDGFVGQVDPLRATDAGIAVVIQDVRGRYGSAGRFTPLVNEAQDGLDTTAWICRQPWSNGRVAMAGASYLGAAQLLCAVAKPAHLAAIVPMVTSGGGFPGPVYTGGALQLGMVATWVAILAKSELDRRSSRGERTSPTTEALRSLLAASPLERVQELARPRSPTRRVADALYEWIVHDRADHYWDKLEVVQRAPRMRTPALHISGWFDSSIGPTLSTAVAARSAGPPHGSDQHLLVGPWTHTRQDGRYEELHLGPEASTESIDLQGQQLRFLRRHLQAIPDDRPPVRIFVMGANRWRDLDDWPPRRAKQVTYYLRGSARATGGQGGGRLSLIPPSDGEPPDVYVYDPANPVPTIGGPSNLDALIPENAGPRDQAPVANRQDVLFYYSEVLEDAVEVTGTVELQLFAATSGRDTDFTAKLVDMHPCGRALGLCEGILRARYRACLRNPEPVEPGEILEYLITLGSTSYVFSGGNRIGLQVSSSSYPRFDPNPNTGNRLADGPPFRSIIAQQMIFHDDLHPSKLLLSVWRK